MFAQGDPSPWQGVSNESTLLIASMKSNFPVLRADARQWLTTRPLSYSLNDLSHCDHTICSRWGAYFVETQ
jgi:hypothetical protein